MDVSRAPIRFNLDGRHLPFMMRWFHAFAGYQEVWRRVRRVLQKLEGLKLDSPVLHNRYRFHLGYEKLLKRNKINRLALLNDSDQAHAFAFIHCTRLAYADLSPFGRDRLRSSIYDSLSPDRDFRALNHELFTFLL